MKQLFGAVALLLPGMAPAKEPPQPLAATGQWTVHADDNLCALARTFGVDAKQVVIGFQPLFTMPQMQIMLVSRDQHADQRTGKATLRFMPSGTQISGSYFSLPAKEKDRRFTRMTVSSEAFDLLRTSSTLTISASPVTTTIRIPKADKAIATFRQCENDLLRSWGIDPATATPERAAKMINPGRAFGPDSYPPEARRKGYVGRVVAVVQVDASGSPTACRVVVGVAPLLNDATCDGAMRRITYTPGTDAAGKPAASVAVLPVNWQLGS